MSLVNLDDYIEEHAASLQPPVCNKMIHNSGKLRIMVVGGPNQRKDYHMNLGEEIFYQIKGRMVLKIMECGAPRDIVIEEGEIFVLPGSIPHSPQRFENTMGLVIERERLEAELDGLRYYVDETNSEVLWQRFFHVTDLGSQLKPLIEEYFASDSFQTRVPDPGMPPAAWDPDTTTLVAAPFLLAHSLADVTAAFAKKDPAAPLPPAVRLFKNEFNVFLVGSETRSPMLPITTEVWVWVVEASAAGEGAAAAVKVTEVGAEEGVSVTLKKVGDTVLLKGGLEHLELSEGSKVLIVFSVGC